MAAVAQMFHADADWEYRGARACPPLTLAEALNAGGLKWQVEAVNLATPAMSVTSPRKVVARLDRPASDPRRVLGIVDSDFAPIQNEQAGQAIDAVFGHGKSVYHTGGYFGNGEKVWLLAKIERPIQVGPDDIVVPYALLINGHDGREPFTIRLTSIRVVCENTLMLAMRTAVGPMFTREHREDPVSCVDAARQFFATAMHDLDLWQESFRELARRACPDALFHSILESLFPDPTLPRKASIDARAWAEWERQLSANRAARAKIEELRESGKGASLPASRGTLWGALNAVTEYMDHHRMDRRRHVVDALLGEGMDVKVRAFQLMQLAARAVPLRDVAAPVWHEQEASRSCCA